MKQLMTGNEAIARGVYEAGVRYASAYPGTPSTEILENVAKYSPDVVAEWAANEKVAIEHAIGASVAGGRAFACMKHVGVNVASDPLFTFAYTGVNAGMVLVSADEPGMHSSQNEQDNRNYARFAKIPLLEPADSQEAKDMVIEAYKISETYDTPVMVRTTTRVSHSKSAVEFSGRQDIPLKMVEINTDKYMTTPANARKLRIKVEERNNRLKEYVETSPLNFIEWHDSEVGIIASGMCYYYAREVFGDTASYLKLGFTNPMPIRKISQFAAKVKKLYIIEENDPIIEETVRLLGYDCLGKSIFPYTGEMTPDVIRKSVFGKTNQVFATDKERVLPRPPSLCAGCPHRGFFYELGKRKNNFFVGDIGCYTLGYDEPYNAMHINIAMGASISMGHGAQQIFNMDSENKMRAVAIIGDSTFFHTGINSLLSTVYNRSNTLTVILDNRITGMTGHQENPGSGYKLQGQPTKSVELEPLVKACGVDHVRTIDPNNLMEVKEALDWGLVLDEPAVIITRWPCVLKKFSKEDLEEFKGAFTKRCYVEKDLCIGCKKCVKVGCSAISFDKDAKKSYILPDTCVGCEVCLQVCPVKAIKKET